MLLPYKFKLMRQHYVVRPLSALQGATGRCYPTLGAIHVAMEARGRARPPEAIQKTFWHEATHAILCDMDSKLWTDEHFVTEFSRRLVKLINTAEFK